MGSEGGEDELEIFRSATVDPNYSQILNIAKNYSEVQVIYAPFSKLFYYIQENVKFEKSNSEEACDVFILKIGVEIDSSNQKLTLRKGFTRKASEVVYKNARHLVGVNDFLNSLSDSDPATTTIYDHESNKKNAGYIVLSYNCGINDPKEIKQIEQLRENTNNGVFDYLVIESASNATHSATQNKITRESKVSMLFGEDLQNFKNFVKDYVEYRAKIKKEIMNGSTCSMFLDSAMKTLISRKKDQECDDEPQAKKQKIIVSRSVNPEIIIEEDEEEDEEEEEEEENIVKTLGTEPSTSKDCDDSEAYNELHLMQGNDTVMDTSTEENETDAQIKILELQLQLAQQKKKLAQK